MRFFQAAFVNQIRNRLRHQLPQQEHVQSRNTAHKKGRVPIVVWYHKIGDESGGQPAQAPKAFQQHNKTPTHMRRHIFTHQSHRHRQLPTQTYAHNKAKHQQPSQIWRDTTQSSSDAVYHQSGGKHGFAANFIGNRTRHDGTDGHADKAYADNQAFFRWRQLPIGGQARHDKRNQTRVHGIKHPPQTHYNQ